MRRTLADRAYDVGSANRSEMSGSIGIAAIPIVEGRANFGNWEQIVAIADRGAYLSKRNGRNAWVSIRGTDAMTEDDFHIVKDDLKTLVDGGRMIVHSADCD